MEEVFSAIGHSPAEITATVIKGEVRIDVGNKFSYIEMNDWSTFLRECDLAHNDIGIQKVTRTHYGKSIMVTFFSVTQCEVRVEDAVIILAIADFFNLLRNFDG